MCVFVYSIVFNLLVGERQWKGFNSIFSLQAFLRRHSEIVERKSEPVTSATSCVSEADIRKWFDEVKEYIKEKKLEEAVNDPSKIFNGDETGF
jgi:hypothetical protein